MQIGLDRYLLMHHHLDFSKDSRLSVFGMRTYTVFELVNRPIGSLLSTQFWPHITWASPLAFSLIFWFCLLFSIGATELKSSLSVSRSTVIFTSQSKLSGVWPESKYAYFILLFKLFYSLLWTSSWRMSSRNSTYESFTPFAYDTWSCKVAKKSDNLKTWDKCTLYLPSNFSFLPELIPIFYSSCKTVTIMIFFISRNCFFAATRDLWKYTFNLDESYISGWHRHAY